MDQAIGINPIQDDLPGEDFWRWALDDEDMIEEFEHRLRGEAYSSKHQCYIQKYEPLMNETGIRELMTDLSLAVPNKSFKLTNLEDEDIFQMAYEFSNAMIKKLRLNFRVYGIKKNNIVSGMILTQFDHLYYSLLRRAKDNTTLRALRETMHRQESVMTQNLPQQRKSFGLFSNPQDQQM